MNQPKRWKPAGCPSRRCMVPSPRAWPGNLGRLRQRQVQGSFDGGSIASDTGAVLFYATDRKLGMTAAAARRIADPRNPLLLTHSVRDMLRERVYGLALGWADLNDHKALRQDVAMRMTVGVDREVATAAQAGEGAIPRQCTPLRMRPLQIRKNTPINTEKRLTNRSRRPAARLQRNMRANLETAASARPARPPWAVHSRQMRLARHAGGSAAPSVASRSRARCRNSAASAPTA